MMKDTKQQAGGGNEYGDLSEQTPSSCGFVHPPSNRVDEEAIIIRDDLNATERTSLVRGQSSSKDQSPASNLKDASDTALDPADAETTWTRELWFITIRGSPLVLAYALQSSLTLTSIFMVGHLGPEALGATALANMTSQITGYGVFIGINMSLDTLCGQAYGAGHRHLVGLNVQRMLWFSLVVCVPVSFIWAFSPQILCAIIPEKEAAALAGLYLQILIIGLPFMSAFFAGQKFFSAQGNFHATFWVLLVCAPLNILLQWLFVWHLGWGFIGAPIAVVCVQILIPFGLLLYALFVSGMDCWGGFSRQAFRNWGPMIRLAVPDVIMVISDSLAFQIVAFLSSFLSTNELAAQSILSTLASLAYRLPFPFSMAASARGSNLMGAGMVKSARTSSEVALAQCTGLGLFAGLVLFLGRDRLPYLFTDDVEVAHFATKCLPLIGAFQVIDAVVTVGNGTLRAIGAQYVGGYSMSFAYYTVSIPITVIMGFVLHWRLLGLWMGPPFGLIVVCIIEGVYLYRTDWNKAADAAAVRNAAG